MMKRKTYVGQEGTDRQHGEWVSEDSIKALQLFYREDYGMEGF